MIDTPQSRATQISNFAFEIAERSLSNASPSRPDTINSTVRFTIDGSGELERQLAAHCRNILTGVQRIIPRADLQALVLGGGYGRAQGGVLKTDDREHAYNDLEFYVFVRGNLLMARKRHRQGLHELGEKLSPEMGLHVEFKLDSIEKLRHSPVSMYTYDLVAGHKIIFGGEKLFAACEHHLTAKNIPASEATRLLFNRCSGLLLVKNLLRESKLDGEQSDFIGRNLAKAQLGLGDAVLTLFGQYHWDCRERHQRLLQLAPTCSPEWLAELRTHHSAGVEFKLHPHRATNSRDEFESQFARLHQLAERIWLWVESRRLKREFDSPRDYALCGMKKCDESGRLRNFLLNLKTFGLRAPFAGGWFRYPRERLFNALSLLLWDETFLQDPPLLHCLQKQLGARSVQSNHLLFAYQNLWQNYG